MGAENMLGSVTEYEYLQGFADTLLKQQQQQQHQQAQQPQQLSSARPPPVPTSAAPAPSQPATLTPASFSPRPPPGVEPRPPFGPRRSSEERERNLRRSQSAIELRSLGGPGLARQNSDADLKHYDRVGVELTTPEGHTYHVGRLSVEDRAQKILR